MVHFVNSASRSGEMAEPSKLNERQFSGRGLRPLSVLHLAQSRPAYLHAILRYSTTTRRGHFTSLRDCAQIGSASFVRRLSSTKRVTNGLKERQNGSENLRRNYYDIAADFRLLALDCSGRFRGDVVDDAVDAADLLMMRVAVRPRNSCGNGK